MPIYVQCGVGCFVWDTDGNTYVDYIGALGPITLGYAFPAIDEAIVAQLRTGIIFSMMLPLEVEVARALQELIPCVELYRICFRWRAVSNASIPCATTNTRNDIIRGCTVIRYLLNSVSFAAECTATSYPMTERTMTAGKTRWQSRRTAIMYDMAARIKMTGNPLMNLQFTDLNHSNGSP